MVSLVVAAAIGPPVSAAAYGFLVSVTKLQEWVYTDLPDNLGFHGPPPWWPFPPLVLAGVLVGLAIRYLPGHGGESPADGFSPTRGAPTAAELPGILVAALASLAFGVVLGPEAPLIALGGGLAVLAVNLGKRKSQNGIATVTAAAGSFAAISTLLGSPLLGAFLLMEVAGLGGGPTAGLVLVPGLLASGIGSLVFIGLGSWTGLGTFSLQIPNLPQVGAPDVAQFGWAFAVGVAAALAGSGIRRLALLPRSRIHRYPVPTTPVAGLTVAGLAVAYAEGTGKSTSDVLFSGESALGPLISHSAEYPVGTLLALFVCKGLAYAASLASFRGGPVFPAMFLGAAGGMALSHLPGLPLIPAVAMGIGAMSVVMLGLPMTSVLLATLLLRSAGLAVMPVVIVAVTVAYVTSARLMPAPARKPEPASSGAESVAPSENRT